MIDLPETPSFRLNGRRALITGASSGIGLACAAALAEAGAAVTLVARRADALSSVVDAMQAKGWSAAAIPMDVSDLDGMATLFDSPFDVVLNAAGLARHGPALETTVADYDTVMALNVRSAYFLSQRAAAALKAADKPGSIIHISSQMGQVGGVDRAVYCASKHALEGMIKAMAIEWGPLGIRINAIGPTFIRTPLTEPTFQNPDRMAWITEKIKLGRPGTVHDIMGAAVYLASDASALVTGTSLLVDGGWTAE